MQIDFYVYNITFLIVQPRVHGAYRFNQILLGLNISESLTVRVPSSSRWQVQVGDTER